MDSFLRYEDNSLRFGKKSIRLADLTVKAEGPVYVYDLGLAQMRLNALKNALPGANVFYAMKANSNPELLKALLAEGAGADVVSGGEIKRAMECGFPPGKIIYSGVGKTDAEIRLALKYGVGQINVESAPELQRIGEIATEMKTKAAVAFRLNPDVDIKTHPYIATGLAENKFGMEFSQLPHLEDILDSFKNSLELVGISLHLGSQMLQFEGLAEGLRRLRPIFEALKIRYPKLHKFDAGGGLGILYDQDSPGKEIDMLQAYAKVIRHELQGLDCQLQLEPGRWIVAHAGVLLTQVVFVKTTSHRTFVIVNSGMNHLIRPALYQAKHRILPVQQDSKRAMKKVDIVGPICESADFFAKEYEMQEMKAGEWVAIADAGAYGFSMANTYNLQDLPGEIVF